jgi:hypothetical protein
VQHLLADRVTAEFYLTQIVSHYSRPAVERFLAEGDRRGLTLPGMFGVFYYRSANQKTLETLREFLPVPVDELREEFGAGATPDQVCARSIRELTAAGVRHFYVSNLPIGRAASTLERNPETGLAAGGIIEAWARFSTAFRSPASSASAT